MDNDLIKVLKPPQPNDNPAVWDLVIKDLNNPLLTTGYSQEIIDSVIIDMRDRDAFGLEKYKTHLQAFNGRPCLVDLYQELLDATVYARQAIAEGKPHLGMIYSLTLRALFQTKLALAAECH